MRNLRYILLILTLYPTLLWGQRRFSIAEQWEYSLAELAGFSTKDVDNQTDVLFGLHASLYTGSHHLLGLSVDGSWSGFINNIPAAKITPGGGAFGFQLVYEYQYSGILIQTGLGFNYQRVFNTILDTAIYHEHMHDTWSSIHDVEFTLKHRFFDRRDMAQQLYGQVPLYFGHYILGTGGIGYFLAGIKLNYAIWGNTKQTLTGTTSGLYERYVGVWEEMDNHGFRKNVPIERTDPKLKLKFDVLAHGEIGYEYTTFQNPNNYRVRPGDRLDCRIRFGAFIDFGIMNILPQGENDFFGVPEETIYDFPTYEMHHVFTTKDAQAFWLRNMFAGIRVTVLFGFQGKEHCILCDPWRH